MGIKDTVKEWGLELWNSKVKNPIANQTENLENQVGQKYKEYSGKFQDYNPLSYYRKQDAFYRGLFWIALGLLVILWIISGS